MQGVASQPEHAIAQVQEGIIVDANPAWLELFGHPADESLVGTPLMDEFEQESHTALKGAIVACLQGKWPGHALHASTEMPDGSSVGVELLLCGAQIRIYFFNLGSLPWIFQPKTNSPNRAIK